MHGAASATGYTETQQSAHALQMLAPASLRAYSPKPEADSSQEVEQSAQKWLGHVLGM